MVSAPNFAFGVSHGFLFLFSFSRRKKNNATARKNAKPKHTLRKPKTTKFGAETKDSPPEIVVLLIGFLEFVFGFLTLSLTNKKQHNSTCFCFLGIVLSCFCSIRFNACIYPKYVKHCVALHFVRVKHKKTLLQCMFLYHGQSNVEWLQRPESGQGFCTYTRQANQHQNVFFLIHMK